MPLLSPASLGQTVDFEHVLKESIFNVLASPWRPCTGKKTVVDHLQSSRFPSSYRPLLARWNTIGRPALQTIKTTNLEELAVREETANLSILQSKLSRTPEDFFAFCQTYCNLSVEVGELEHIQRNKHYNSKQAFENIKQTLISALELDRSVCLEKGAHDCLGQRFWSSAFLIDIRELSHRLVTNSPLLAVQHFVNDSFVFDFTAEHHGRHAQQGAIADVSEWMDQFYPGCPNPSSPHLLASPGDLAILSDLEDPSSSRGISSPHSDPSTWEELGSEAGTSDPSREFGLLGEVKYNDLSHYDIPPSSDLHLNCRKERNRIKSKRHRDRMIKQRLLLLDIIVAFAEAVSKPELRPLTTVGQKIYEIISISGEQNKSSKKSKPLSSKQRERKPRQRSKAMQRIDELERFNQVHRIICLLSQQDVEVEAAFEVPDSGKLNPHHKRGEEKRFFLDILIAFKDRWDLLIDAERRLFVSIPFYSETRKPIADFVSRMRRVVTIL